MVTVDISVPNFCFSVVLHEANLSIQLTKWLYEMFSKKLMLHQFAEWDITNLFRIGAMHIMST